MDKTDFCARKFTKIEIRLKTLNHQIIPYKLYRNTVAKRDITLTE